MLGSFCSFSLLSLLHAADVFMISCNMKFVSLHFLFRSVLRHRWLGDRKGKLISGMTTYNHAEDGHFEQINPCRYMNNFAPH